MWWWCPGFQKTTSSLSLRLPWNFSTAAHLDEVFQARSKPKGSLCVVPHRIRLWIPSVHWSQTLVIWERPGALRIRGALPLRSYVKPTRQLTCSCVSSGLALLGLHHTRPTLTIVPCRSWPHHALPLASGSWAPTHSALGATRGKNTNRPELNLVFETLQINYSLPQPSPLLKLGGRMDACIYSPSQACIHAIQLNHYSTFFVVCPSKWDNFAASLSLTVLEMQPR